MSVQVKGSGTIGGLDEGLVVSGIVTSSTQINVGSNIKLGNAGVVTATSFVGSGANLTGIDATKIITGNTQVQTIDTGSDGHVKVITEGSERLRIADAASTFQNKLIIDDGSNGHLFLNNTSSENAINSGTTGFAAYKNLVINAAQHIFKVSNTERLRIDSSGRLLLGTTTEGVSTGDKFTIATSGNTGMTIRSGTSNEGNIFFSDATSGTGEYAGSIQYNHGSNFLTIGTNGSERLRINNSGEFGVGTDTPLRRLHVKSGANTNDGAFRIESATNNIMDMGTDGTGHFLNCVNADPLRIKFAGTETLRIKSDGIIEIGTSTGASSDANIRLKLGRTGDCFLGIRATGSTTSETGIKFGDSASEHDGKFTYLHNGQRFRITVGGNDRIFIESNGDLKGQSSNANIIGFMGAKTTAGTTNWNDSTNARSGNGYTLLLGSHSNGPGPGLYYHPFTFEYTSRDGNGNMTQLAIPYNGGAIYSRYRYSGSWSGWTSH